MRLLLSVVLVGGVVGVAAAADYDARLYISPTIGHVAADAGRGRQAGDEFAVTVGLPVSDTRNYELELGFADVGQTNLYNLNARLLSFFDAQTPALYGVLSAGALFSDGGPGENYLSPNLAAGLGGQIPLGFGKIRIEGLLRGDLHYNEKAGLGGKRAFVEPIIRLGYTIPFGPEPKASSPGDGVGVVSPAGADSDRDGVSDEADLCPGTALGTVVDATGCPVPAAGAAAARADCRAPALDEAVDQFGCAVDRAVILRGVNFEFDSDVLTAEAETILDDVAQVLAGMPEASIEIAGHTSDEGDQYYNIDLSQRRSEAVRRYLINAGVPASQMRARGYGDNAPLGSNDTARGRRENRRVEVRIIG